MIVAEIYVPVLDVSYDFKLDENVPTGVVIEEINSVSPNKHFIFGLTGIISSGERLS